ncbi:WYL domain-containing protein [Terrisporobacter petrolearius]|uniref:helix-turn-helix transcriptional regulator n=1 Tax=Terrisporobacter petrolearius TaxID=1460447 RepID=UPI001D15EAA5|nr:WYL domain-containing protein [Terrisporobacter petrolearius]MCC3865675.1 WYL domain-containing protein [Terrisporobacter petrolearius]
MSNYPNNSAIVRALEILKILKKETDEEHSLTQDKILFKLKQRNYDCNIKTLNKTLKELRLALNPYTYDEFSKDDFRIVFPGYDKFDSKELRMTNLRYVHEFSMDEVDSIIEAIQFSKTLSNEKSKIIIEKVKGLTSKYYKNKTNHINTVPQFSTINKKILKQNLITIQQAIEDKVKISFFFNRYNRAKQLENSRSSRYVISPYYIAAYNGKYYLLANTEPYENTSIYRIDLMTDIQIPKEDNTKGIRRKSIRNVRGISEVWNPEDFMIKHMNMFYDDPMTIGLKVKNHKYTIIHDWFGDQYTFKKKIDENYDEIEVVCSPNAVVHWAMQYCNYVEVISPIFVRDDVISILKNMVEKYDIRI